MSTLHECGLLVYFDGEENVYKVHGETYRYQVFLKGQGGIWNRRTRTWDFDPNSCPFCFTLRNWMRVKMKERLSLRP